MRLSDILGEAIVDFTLPSLGGVVPNVDYCCETGAGKSCVGISTCKNNAGYDCPQGKSTCKEHACTAFVSNSVRCVLTEVCGVGPCSSNYS